MGYNRQTRHFSDMDAWKLVTMPHYVYLIECINGSYYTGYTTDIERRYQEHQQGSRKCRYTRSFPPKKLAAYWLFSNRADALSVEQTIKKRSKAAKQQLVATWQRAKNRHNG